ncbi:restriction endonuclease subunit S [Campylobacter devanensis]|uniref:restriction endonuclease subunit S n=1 Tax=Campylobacter devanensis TaxID=3161138 RepID=UPI000A347FEA|nr:restriction endonuclease subunit S [Campylobacter sp. P159]
MSKLEELINKLCPNGVEFLQLRNLVEFTNGKGHEKVVEENGQYILITSKAISTNMEQVRRINKILTPLYKDDIAMVMSDLPNGKTLAKCFIVDENDKYALNQRVCGLKIKESRQLLSKFLFYILNRNSQLLRYDNGVDQTNLRKDDILNISIPLPPLEVQCEIVRILDNFTLLSAELSAELSARQKQYEYYSKELFNFNDDVEFISLESIADIGTGSSNTNEAVEDGQYPFYVRSQQVYYKNNYEYDDNSIITSGDGVGVGKIFHYTDGKYALHQRAYRINITNNKVNSKYFYYYMKSTFYDYIQKNAFNSSVTSIRRPMLNKYPVPILSLEKQNKIVNILENFDKLCNDISEGLPAEIEARKKQYEYYRDKLLTFKELK